MASRRQLPWKTPILLGTHTHHSSVLPDLEPDSSHRRPPEVQSMTHEETHYTPKELLGFSHLYRQRSRDCVWENSKRNKTGSGQIYWYGRAQRGSAFRVAAQRVTKSSNSWFLGRNVDHKRPQQMNTKCQACLGLIERKGFKGLGRLER